MVYRIRATLVACALGSVSALIASPTGAQDVAPVTALPLESTATPAPTTPAPTAPAPTAPPAPTTTTSPVTAPSAPPPAVSTSPASAPVESSAPAVVPPSGDTHMAAEEEASSLAAPAAATEARPSTSYSSSSYVDTGDMPPALPNRSMLVGGTTLLVASYLPAVIVGAAKDRDGDNYLYYPVAGPWLYLARRDHDAAGKAMLVIDGIAQDMGALHMLLSLVVPERPRVARFQHHVAERRVNVLPRVTKQRDLTGTARYNFGLLASGHF